GLRNPRGKSVYVLAGRTLPLGKGTRYRLWASGLPARTGGFLEVSQALAERSSDVAQAVTLSQTQRGDRVWGPVRPVRAVGGRGERGEEAHYHLRQGLRAGGGGHRQRAAGQIAGDGGHDGGLGN